MSPVTRPRGRPVQLDAQARETAILDAVERIVACSGLDRASMTAIAREAGMSKRTLYDIFANRAALMAACVRRIRSSAISPLSSDQQALPLRHRLRMMLTPDMHHLQSNVPLAFLRAVIASAPSQTDMAQSFQIEGPVAARALLRAELARAIDQGELPPIDTNRAAALLHDMVYGHVLENLIDPDPTPPDARETDARLRFAIGVFLDGLAGGTECNTAPLNR